MHGWNFYSQTPQLNSLLNYDRDSPNDNDQIGRRLIVDYLITNADIFVRRVHTPFQLLFALKALNESWPRLPSRVPGARSYVGGEVLSHFAQLAEALGTWRLMLLGCFLGLWPWALARAAYETRDRNDRDDT